MNLLVVMPNDYYKIGMKPSLNVFIKLTDKLTNLYRPYYKDVMVYD